MYTGGVIVNIVELGSGLVPARYHCAHAQTVTPVLIHGVSQQLRCSSDRDPFFVAQLVQPTTATKVPLPELAVRRPSSHGAQQERVDLDDLLYALGGCMDMTCEQLISIVKDGNYEWMLDVPI